MRASETIQNGTDRGEGTVQRDPSDRSQVQWMAASFVIANPRAADDLGRRDQALGPTRSCFTAHTSTGFG